MALTDAQIRKIRPEATPRKFSDGGGLHLLVTPTGSKLWRLNYRFGGKQKTQALGSYPAVSLETARELRLTAKKQLSAGVDPSQHAKLERVKRSIASANTFGVVAEEILAKDEREGRAPATLSKKRWLLELARSDLWSRPISEITAAEILVSLRRVEVHGNLESARRMRSTIGQVFRYAIATARAENDPTGGLKGALTAPTVRHRPALTDRDAFAGLLRAVWGYEGQPETKAALQLMVYLYPRPGELRQAEWAEFDLGNAEWTIPATRAKMRRAHRKPLPPQAVTVLRDLHRLNGDGRLAFPSVRSRLRPISENTLNAALRRLGYSTDQATSHGFRASASSLLNESGKWQPDAIEAELGHVGADEVRKAYHRATYWEARVEMSAWWADEIDRMRAPTVDIFG